MKATELIRSPRTPSPPEPTFREIAQETVDLAEVVAVAGPPVLFLAGPWAFLTLMLAAPFAVAVTLVALFVAAAALVGLFGAVLVAPFLLVRHVRERRRAHRPTPAPAVQLLARESVSAA
jgi:hypothetical protein